VGNNHTCNYVLIISGFGYGWIEYHRKHADTTDLKAAVKKEAMTLIREFEDDETGANLLYNDKILSIKGKVLRIENNGLHGMWYWEMNHHQEE
jgi:hypothetical protein